METEVEFRSTKFRPYEGEQEQINLNKILASDPDIREVRWASKLQR